MYYILVQYVLRYVLPSYILTTFREASHIDFVHEKRHMDVLLETPTPPPLEASHTFFDSVEAPGELFILQA